MVFSLAIKNNIFEHYESKVIYINLFHCNNVSQTSPQNTHIYAHVLSNDDLSAFLYPFACRFDFSYELWMGRPRAECAGLERDDVFIETIMPVTGLI